MKKEVFLTGCLAALAAAGSPAVLAGWTGQMNGTGFGKAAVNVTSAAGTPKAAATPLGPEPSVGMVQGAFKYGTDLPAGASASTTANVVGSAGYVWKANTIATGGDRTDNFAIQQLVNITPQPFASLSLATSVIPDTEDGVGFLLDILYKASGGTALLFRGLWWEDPYTPPTEDEINEFNVLLDGLIIGAGEPDPSRRAKEAFIELPDDLNENNWDKFILVTDGFADSAVPDGGSLSFAFGLSAAGLFLARKKYSAA